MDNIAGTCLRRRQDLLQVSARAADIAGVPSPLPGSVDEYEARARVARLVARGRAADSLWEARLGVEIATERLAQLPRSRRQFRIGAACNLLLGAVNVLIGPLVIGIALLALGVTAAVAGPWLLAYLRRRLERSLRLNREVAEAPS